MRLSAVALLFLISVLALAGAADAAVTLAPVTVDDPKPALQTDGTGWKVSVGVTNVTDGTVPLKLEATDPKPSAKCQVTLPNAPPSNTIDLVGATHKTVDVSYSAGCAVGAAGVAFTLAPQTDPKPMSTIAITSSAKPKAKVEWGVLWWFVYGFGGGLVLLIVACLGLKAGAWTTLHGLPDTWKFSDSWASSITVLGGLLTGVVGSSDTVKAILGDDADTALARATVAVAIAAALVAFAAVVLQVLKNSQGFTVLGLVVAGAIVVGAAFGELYIVWKTGEQLDLGGIHKHLGGAFYLVAFVLAVYSFRNMRSTVAAGIKESPPAVSESAIVAAALSSSLAEGKSNVQDLLAAVQAAFEEEAKAAKAKKPAAVGAEAPAEAATPKVLVVPRPVGVARPRVHAAML